MLPLCGKQRLSLLLQFLEYWAWGHGDRRPGFTRPQSQLSRDSTADAYSVHDDPKTAQTARIICRVLRHSSA